MRPLVILRKVLTPFVYFFWYLPSALLCFFLFRILCRMTLVGKENRPARGGAMLAANHLSAADSWVIGHVFLPRRVFFPAKEELFRNPLLGFLLHSWNAFPVPRGYADRELLQHIAAQTRKHLVLIHPEGTRQRTGKLGRGKRGVGKIIYLSRPVVLPIFIDGTQRVLPVGAMIPRFFKRLYVHIGKPVPLEDLYALPDTKDTARRIVERIMQHIADSRRIYLKTPR